MAVAKAAIAAAQQHDALARTGQVGNEALLVVGENLRPDRYAQHGVAPLGAGFVRAGAAAPVLRPEMLLVAVIDQRVEVVGGDEDDVATLPAIAAIGPAEFDEFLAAKAHRAAPAISALQIDLALVEKFHGLVDMKQKGERLGRSPRFPVGVGNGYSAASAGRSLAGRSFAGRGTTEMNVRPPIPFLNCTAPSSSAKSVWSRPMPTRSPGWNLVPRWRTMMLPGMTISPPYFLTPSRRPALSRPLREEPPAFLCAILSLLRLRRRLRRPPAARSPACGRGTIGVDLVDPQHGLVLAVAVFAAVIVPPLFLEDDDLVGPALLDQRRADRGAGQERGAGRHGGAVAEHQHLAKLDRGARLAGELLDG